MDMNEAVRAIVREELATLSSREPEKADEYLNTKQVAELTGLSVSYFEVGRSLGAADRPPYSRLGRRVVYRRCDVEAWIASRKRGA